MKDISVIIPVYRESKLVPKVLDTLMNQEMDTRKYEVIVVVDEPTKRFLNLLKKYDRVKVIVNRRRIGKASALNKAVENSSGNILLFLDDDIILPNDRHYLKKIIEEMKDTDILDIRKEVINTHSLLSRLTYYEYAGFNISSWFVSKFVRRHPTINGSAFAIRREVFVTLGGFKRVILEDMDIAARAFFKNYRFKYTKRISVYNIVHSKWKNWLVQRKRWSLGCALWWKEWWKDLLKTCARQPQVFVPGLLFLSPSIVLFLLHLFIPDVVLCKIFSLIFFLLATKLDIVFPILWLTVISVDLVRGLFASMVSFFATSGIFFAFSKKLNFRFKLREFLVYYFFYSLLALIIQIVALIIVFLFEERTVGVMSDWKV